MFENFSSGLGNFFDGSDLAYQRPGLGGGGFDAAQPPEPTPAVTAPPAAEAQAERPRVYIDTPAATESAPPPDRPHVKQGPGGQLGSFIQTTNQKYGLPDNYLARTAKIESSFNPRDVSSTGAAGLFQFTRGTAKRMGLSDPFDPIASTDAAARLAIENKAALAKKLGREPTGGELYLAHQQGAAGASALLARPDANVVEALAPAYGGNRAAARRAVTVNGGNPNMTAGDFAGKWTSKFEGTSTAVASNRMSDQDYRDAFPNAPRLDTGRVDVASNSPSSNTTGPSDPPSPPSSSLAAGPSGMEGFTPGLGGHRPMGNPFAGIKAPEIDVKPLTRGPVARAPQIVDPNARLVLTEDQLPMNWQA